MVTGSIFGALSIVAKGPGSSHRRTIMVEPSANPCIVALWSQRLEHPDGDHDLSSELNLPDLLREQTYPESRMTLHANLTPPSKITAIDASNWGGPRASGF